MGKYFAILVFTGIAALGARLNQLWMTATALVLLAFTLAIVARTQSESDEEADDSQSLPSGGSSMNDGANAEGVSRFATPADVLKAVELGVLSKQEARVMFGIEEASPSSERPAESDGTESQIKQIGSEGGI